jgi:tetratricopeptide (TPR) repeat protein
MRTDKSLSGREQAEQVASELEAIPVNQSNAAAIAKGEEALLLLKEEPGSKLWFQLQLRLGSMLLESPDGNQADNYDRATDHYRAALERALPDNVAVAWIAMSGLANALSLHPRAGREDLEAAFKLYEKLSSHYRDVDDLDSLAVVLGNYSHALTRGAKLWNMAGSATVRSAGTDRGYGDERRHD